MKNIIIKIYPFYRFIYSQISSIYMNIYMLVLKIKLKELGKYTRVYKLSATEPFNVSIGHHTYINKNCEIVTTGSSVSIGNFVMVGPRVTFIAQNHVISDWKKPMILNNNYEKGNIKISDDVWIGANSTILAGVKVGRGSVIAAGAVVVSDVEPFSVMGGVPARIIKKRFIGETLKKANERDFNSFENSQIDWNTWGVGEI